MDVIFKPMFRLPGAPLVNVTELSLQEPSLIACALSNDLDQARLLLQHGALVNARNSRGKTALHIAARLGHLDFVGLLLEHKADQLFAQCKDGSFTPLISA